MNKAMLTGRLTRDPDIGYYQSNGEQRCRARFTLAVDRRGSRSQDGNNGQQTADFISCVAFGRTGEFVEKYAKKGMKFDVVGHIQTGSYQNKEGQTVYTTDVIVDEIEFGESKRASESNGGGYGYGAAADRGGGNAGEAAPQAQQADDGFMNVPEDMDDELPFN